MDFVRKNVGEGAKTLRSIIKRGWMLVPAVKDPKAFYRWVGSYTSGDITHPRMRLLPGDCEICRNSHYVLTRRRELIPCPRWSRDSKRCER